MSANGCESSSSNSGYSMAARYNGRPQSRWSVRCEKETPRPVYLQVDRDNPCALYDLSLDIYDLEKKKAYLLECILRAKHELQAQYEQVLSSSVLPDLTKRRRSHIVNPTVLHNLLYLCSPYNPEFKKRVGLSYVVWRKLICDPLAWHLEQRESDHPSACKHQLIPELRIFRFYLILKGESHQSLSDLTDQHTTIVTRDFDLILKLACRLSDYIVRPPLPDSSEYANLRGKVDFRWVTNAILSADGTRTFHNRPSKHHIIESQFYSYFKRHGSHTTFFTDCLGRCRAIIGPVGLKTSETAMIALSPLYKWSDGFQFLLQLGDVVLFDGGLADTHLTGFAPKYRGKATITAWWKRITKNWDRLSQTEQATVQAKYDQDMKRARLRDRHITKARYIVEHFFMRLQAQFPLIKTFKQGEIMKLDKIIRVCSMYMNFIIDTDAPMRRHTSCCDEFRCLYCTYLKDNPDWFKLSNRPEWLQLLDQWKALIDGRLVTQTNQPPHGPPPSPAVTDSVGTSEQQPPVSSAEDSLRYDDSTSLGTFATSLSDPDLDGQYGSVLVQMDDAGNSIHESDDEDVIYYEDDQEESSYGDDSWLVSSKETSEWVPTDPRNLATMSPGTRRAYDENWMRNRDRLLDEGRLDALMAHDEQRYD